MNLLKGLLLSVLVLHILACDEEHVTVVDPDNSRGFTNAEYTVISEVLSLPWYFDNYQSPELQQFSGIPGFNGTLGNASATLGRVLFYDKQLSRDYSVSCASCHQQQHAFSDNVAFSTGIEGHTTERNSLPLGSFESFSNEYGSSGSISSSQSKSLFWDMRAPSLFTQMTQTIANDREMGMELKDIVQRLNGQEHYRILFAKANPGSQGFISEGQILSALREFMSAMRVDRTHFDLSLDAASKASEMQPKDIIENNIPGLTASENRGKTLFIQNCASCHAETIGLKALGIPDSKRPFYFQANNGLDLAYSDEGVASFTANATDVGKFKVPVLRNVALTAPYMHDGRFQTLEEVLDFYSENIQSHPNLDERLQENGKPKRFHFSTEDKRDIIAFLNTLKDMSTLGGAKFSNPWK